MRLRLRGLRCLETGLPVSLGQVLVHLGRRLETRGFRLIRLGDGLVIRRDLGGLDLTRIERRAFGSPYAT